MNRLLVYALLLHAGLSTCLLGEKAPPNVLFIVIDDMNDWTTLFDKSNPIRTPNLERLAERGTFFTKAYCNSPACNPSRASALSGVRPSTSGVYGNRSDWRKALAAVDILPLHFQKSGYRTYASGKIFHHHGPQFHHYDAFSEHSEFPSSRPDKPMPSGGNLNGITHWTAPDGSTSPVSPNFDWGVYPDDPTHHIDHRSVAWAIERLQRRHDKPFFIATGIFRPHMPFYAAQRWFDEYPLQSLVMPTFRGGDLADLPQAARSLLHPPGRRFMSTFAAEQERRDEALFRKAVRGYQAASSFADYQVGRLLDALDRSDHAENTVIVLCSDHGFHLGEKDHWEKFVLYEKATRIPLIIAAPGQQASQRCERPVSLIDLFPTLVELGDLKRPDHLEGKSLVPLLQVPTAQWEPALMTYGADNHAVRSDRFRYIRYRNGGEELYDLENDPYEWTNLADREDRRPTMNQLARWMPDHSAPEVGPAK